jgi:TorA maturation chaperone TorD
VSLFRLSRIEKGAGNVGYRNTMSTRGDRQAVSEILKVFSGLFDGPPPTAVAEELLATTFPALRRVLNLPATTRHIEAADFEREYEALFLIPTHDHVSLYTSHHRQRETVGPWDDFSRDLAVLAETLHVPWKKEGFVPGRSYPLAPDHLSVELGLAAIMMTLDPDLFIAGHAVISWLHRIMEDASRALEQMKDYLGALAPPLLAYGESVEIAAAFLKECVTMKAWNWRENDRECPRMEMPSETFSRSS